MQNSNKREPKEELVKTYKLVLDVAMDLTNYDYQYPLGRLHNEDEKTRQECSGFVKGAFHKSIRNLLCVLDCARTSTELESAIHGGKRYERPPDPGSMAALIRAALDCLLLVNHVFVNPPTNEEMLFRFDLWQAANANRLAQLSLQPLIKESKEYQEKILIQKGIAKRLQYHSLYHTLNDRSQKIINKLLDYNITAKWMYIIEGEQLVEIRGWSGLAEQLSLIQPEIYSILSELIHPSILSSYSFNIENEPPIYHINPNHLLGIATNICCLIIREICLCFPPLREQFYKLSDEQKNLIFNSLKFTLGEGKERF